MTLFIARCLNLCRYIFSEIPLMPDADDAIDVDLLHSVKPAELNSKM